VLKIKHYLNRLNKKIEELSDWTADISAHPMFLLFHIVWWGCWIGFKVEPFPYGLLTLVVSLEAIVLSSLLLSSGNREGEAEKKITRKNLRLTSENNLIAEETLELLKDLHEDVRLLREEEE
jgi:uncharacterized membrane protein